MAFRAMGRPALLLLVVSRCLYALPPGVLGMHP